MLWTARDVCVFHTVFVFVFVVPAVNFVVIVGLIATAVASNNVNSSASSTNRENECERGSEEREKSAATTEVRALSTSSSLGHYFPTRRIPLCYLFFRNIPVCCCVLSFLLLLFSARNGLKEQQWSRLKENGGRKAVKRGVKLKHFLRCFGAHNFIFYFIFFASTSCLVDNAHFSMLQE